MLGLVLFLVAVAALVGAVGFARAHPKPANEPLETYVEDSVKEVVQEAETVVKKVTPRKKKAPPTK